MNNINQIERSAGGIVVNKDSGKIIIVYQNNTNTWSIPKGHINKGETLLSAALREIYEETGLHDIEYEKKIGTIRRGSKKQAGVKKIITVFLFSTRVHLISPRHYDIAKCVWVNINEAIKIMSYAEDVAFITKNVAIISRQYNTNKF